MGFSCQSELDYELYDRLESLGQDRPDLLLGPDWNFDPASFDLPARIQSMGQKFLEAS